MLEILSQSRVRITIRMITSGLKNLGLKKSRPKSARSMPASFDAASRKLHLIVLLVYKRTLVRDCLEKRVSAPAKVWWNVGEELRAFLTSDMNAWLKCTLPVVGVRLEPTQKVHGHHAAANTSCERHGVTVPAFCRVVDWSPQGQTFLKSSTAYKLVVTPRLFRLIFPRLAVLTTTGSPGGRPALNSPMEVSFC